MNPPDNKKASQNLEGIVALVLAKKTPINMGMPKYENAVIP
ncbi:MAG: hypothetical protein V7K38_23635 [Nostoc sp.]